MIQDKKTIKADKDKNFNLSNAKYYSLGKLEYFLKDKNTDEYYKNIIRKLCKLVITAKPNEYKRLVNELIKSASN